FKITAKFPKEEVYSLVSQMRNSSRSVPANIAEGWSKRRYENLFKKHLTDAIGSCDEIKVWLDFSLDCNYIDGKIHVELIEEYSKLGKMLFKLLENWKTYA
ncbi:MAG: four helix bundle protein, partial [Candidatus Aminicenantia bacterium]